jgi:hypothetical protein
VRDLGIVGDVCAALSWLIGTDDESIPLLFYTVMKAIRLGSNVSIQVRLSGMLLKASGAMAITARQPAGPSRTAARVTFFLSRSCRSESTKVVPRDTHPFILYVCVHRSTLLVAHTV